MLNVQLSQNDPLLATNAVKKRSSKWIFALIAMFLFIAAVAYVYTNPVIETPSVHQYVEEEMTDDEALEADRKGRKGGGSAKKGGKSGKTGGKRSKGSKGGYVYSCPPSEEDFQMGVDECHFSVSCFYGAQKCCGANGEDYPTRECRCERGSMLCDDLNCDKAICDKGDDCPADTNAMTTGSQCSFSGVCHKGVTDCCGTEDPYPAYDCTCVNGVVQCKGHGCASKNCPITDQCPASIRQFCSFSGVCEYGTKHCEYGEIKAHRCTCDNENNLMNCDDTTCGVVGKGACPSETDFQMMGPGECDFSVSCNYGIQKCCGANGEDYPSLKCRCEGGSKVCDDWNCDIAICK